MLQQTSPIKVTKPTVMVICKPDAKSYYNAGVTFLKIATNSNIMHRTLCFSYNNLLKYPEKPTLIRVWHTLTFSLVSTITLSEMTLFRATLSKGFLHIPPHTT